VLPPPPPPCPLFLNQEKNKSSRGLAYARFPALSSHRVQVFPHFFCAWQLLFVFPPFAQVASSSALGTRYMPFLRVLISFFLIHLWKLIVLDFHRGGFQMSFENDLCSLWFCSSMLRSVIGWNKLALCWGSFTHKKVRSFKRPTEKSTSKNCTRKVLQMQLFQLLPLLWPVESASTFQETVSRQLHWNIRCLHCNSCRNLLTWNPNNKN